MYFIILTEYTKKEKIYNYNESIERN